MSHQNRSRSFKVRRQQTKTVLPLYVNSTDNNTHEITRWSLRTVFTDMQGINSSSSFPIIKGNLNLIYKMPNVVVGNVEMVQVGS
jgi:hypothetical protein